ncbi:tyrosine-protein phosphatase non-receptor type 5 isoform X2 [Oryzias latipes]
MWSSSYDINMLIFSELKELISCCFSVEATPPPIKPRPFPRRLTVLQLIVERPQLFLCWTSSTSLPSFSPCRRARGAGTRPFLQADLRVDSTMFLPLWLLWTQLLRPGCSTGDLLPTQHPQRISLYPHQNAEALAGLHRHHRRHSSRLAKATLAGLSETHFRQEPDSRWSGHLLARLHRLDTPEPATASARQLVTMNVLQAEQTDPVWSRDGLYAVVLFFTVFFIVVTCLMVLYRTKEVSERQRKAPPPVVHQSKPAPLDPVRRSKGTKGVTSGSMVQIDPPPPVATPTYQQQQVPACRRLAPLPSPAPVINGDDAHLTQVASSNELKPCPSPFRMKPAAGLQERRGSNVSLVLDMSALGAVEPLNVAVVTPKEAAAREYLLSAGRPLTRQQLQDAVNNTHTLHVEFAEIPMNFIDPKELDVPNHGTKNRYKTILPNPHSRVILKTKSGNDLLSSYINANYIRGYLGDSKAFIATQGPMVNTVNDFWQMAWQEEAPVIVMITKLKEKNEKCVLYWPEKRGIYGRVEVLVNAVRECEHYTTRSLTLKCGNQTRVLQHYWYTSWPDHKTPDSALPLLQLMADVEADRRAAAAVGPVIVHCSAGIGRTGCFIATTIGCRQLQVEGVVDILSITCQLRADRGGMIQTGEQYEFVHHALSLFEARLSAETSQ